MLEEIKDCEKQKASVGVDPYLNERPTEGSFAINFNNLRSSPSNFKENFGLTPQEFDVLLNLLEPTLRTICTNEISLKEQLAFVLEYLTAEDPVLRFMASVYRISEQNLGAILDEIGPAICELAKHKNVNQTKYRQIAKRFNLMWEKRNQ